jgi:hypothetical protein
MQSQYAPYIRKKKPFLKNPIEKNIYVCIRGIINRNKVQF